MKNFNIKPIVILIFILRITNSGEATCSDADSLHDCTLVRQKRYTSRPKGWDPMKAFGYGSGVEDLLDPKTYHKYIRPGVTTTSTKPLDVNISIAITSMDKISEADMEYTITFTLYQTWQDDRLNKPRLSRLEKPITMDSTVVNRFWVPDTYIVNAKTSFIHDVTTRNGLLILHPNGKVMYVLRITSQVSCPMKLLKFPMDRQVCKLLFSSWSFSEKDLLYHWNGKKECGMSSESVIGMEDVVLPQFSVTKCGIYASRHKRILGNYSELVMEFGLKRNVRFFLFQTYVPSILLVMLSWVSFWINVDAVPARVALGITTILSMTTLMIGVYKNGPKSTATIKAIDLYVLVCYGFIFLAMIEYAVVHYYIRHAAKKAKIAVNKKSATSQTEKDQRNHDVTSVEAKNDNGFTVISVSMSAAEEKPCNGIARKANKFKTDKEACRTMEHRLRVEKIDFYFMIAFPTLFIAFNFGYWIIYTLIDD